MRSIQSIFFSVTLLLLLAACSKDEEPGMMGGNTEGTRYKDQVFTEVTETRDIAYGENTTQGGTSTTLFIDVFEPANDTETSRPLVILAHGGGFAEGDKEDMHELARSLAKAGYVAASMSYRLTGDGALSFAVVDAVQDMKAAVRYFTTSNRFDTNPNNIFIGGFSAGAVTALHYAYLNNADIASLPTELQQYLEANGGLSGSSGNPGASETIKGVINIAGGLINVNVIGANEPILYSIHGDNDVDVYCTKDPESQANPEGDFTEGSCLIHPILDGLGITNQFRRIAGGDHGAYFTCADCDAEMRNFLFENL